MTLNELKAEGWTIRKTEHLTFNFTYKYNGQFELDTYGERMVIQSDVLYYKPKQFERGTLNGQPMKDQSIPFDDVFRIRFQSVPFYPERLKSNLKKFRKLIYAADLGYANRALNYPIQTSYFE